MPYWNQINCDGREEKIEKSVKILLLDKQREKIGNS